MTAWQSTLVELLRHKGDIGILRRGDEYLVARADKPVTEFSMELDEADFLHLLEELRYAEGSTEAKRQEALQALTGVVTRMLALELPTGATQVDLVLSANELVSLPFEAAEASAGQPLFIRDAPIEITRRVRGAFRDRQSDWPSKPRMLFAAADPYAAADPECAIPIEKHIEAVRHALTPWIEPLPGFADQVPHEEDVLTILPHASLGTLREACLKASDRPYTHVHLLAHGCVVDPGLMQKYGVTLHGDGDDDTADATAEQLVEALAAGGHLPTVVTLASCDSANVGSPIVARSSLAHVLHVAGIPVVVGSQFPLTVAGSTQVIKSFYSALLAGEDVRDAIHRARICVYDCRDETHNDWVSLVAYVQLPEGYADHLVNVRLQAELASLRTAQAWADQLAQLPSAGLDAYEHVASRLRERTASLQRWVADSANAAYAGALEENRGLLGSACKRLAELLFNGARVCEDPDEWRHESHIELERGRGWYRAAFDRNLSAHWHAVQALSLDVVLDGSIVKPWQLDAALAAAETACHSSADEYWAWGSLAELHLLMPYAGRERQLDEAVAALDALRRKALSSNPYAIESTARQLARYVTWWTSANGFFKEEEDLVDDVTTVAASAGIDLLALAFKASRGADLDDVDACLRARSSRQPESDRGDPQ